MHARGLTAVVAGFWIAGCARNEAPRDASDPTASLAASVSQRETPALDLVTRRGATRDPGEVPAVALTDPIGFKAI